VARGRLQLHAGRRWRACMHACVRVCTAWPGCTVGVLGVVLDGHLAHGVGRVVPHPQPNVVLCRPCPCCADGTCKVFKEALSGSASSAGSSECSKKGGEAACGDTEGCEWRFDKCGPSMNTDFGAGGGGGGEGGETRPPWRFAVHRLGPGLEQIRPALQAGGLTCPCRRSTPQSRA